MPKKLEPLGDEEIQELEALHRSAGAGAWGIGRYWEVIREDGGLVARAETTNSRQVASYLARIHNALPALLAEISAARGIQTGRVRSRSRKGPSGLRRGPSRD